MLSARISCGVSRGLPALRTLSTLSKSTSQAADAMNSPLKDAHPAIYGKLGEFMASQQNKALRPEQWVDAMNVPLEHADPELHAILELEKDRQRCNLNLIPSENFTSEATLDALGSPMSNKYSEGYPGTRYYGGNEFIDQAELLCQARALDAFDLDPELWGVNVQALSGAPANLAVYNALLNPHDRIMGLSLPHGGHLSHGFYSPTKSISVTSKFYESLPYHLDPKTERIDYDEVDKMAPIYRPKIIVAGASAYSRLIDHERLRMAADSCGAYLMGDMAHISGMVAAGLLPSPFDHCDVVTTTSHKSLRGPRGAMIFFRKGIRSVNSKGVETKYDLEDRINFSVFPGLQGGPHNHTISALAVALAQTQTPEFVAYQRAVLDNAQVLAKALQGYGYRLVSGGTDNHLLLVDISDSGIDGARIEHVLDRASITINKNTVPSDKSALKPHGLRLGTPALTTRGFQARDFEKVAELLHRGIDITRELSMALPSKSMAKFKAAYDSTTPAIAALKEEAEAFAREFPICGHR